MAIGYICYFLLLPFGEVAVSIYAFSLNHYIKSGGWFVRGGVGKIPHTLLRTVQCHGGEIRMGAQVEQILIKNKRAYGVKLTTGEKIHAPVVVSNADIKTTYDKLIDHRHTSVSKRRRISKAKLTPSLFSVYLGVDIDLREHLSSKHIFSLSNLDFDGQMKALYLGDGEEYDTNAPAIWITSTILKMIRAPAPRVSPARKLPRAHHRAMHSGD